MYDLKIINARIVDGSGADSFMGELAVLEGRIAAIERSPGHIDGAASEVIDAQGLVLSPGFVDVHTHYDAQVFWDKTVSPSCYHGVTTIFGGHCGFSIAPLNAEAAPYLLNMLARVEGMPVASLQEGVPWDWRSFADFLGKLDGNLGVNAGFMAGHSAIRRVVMGERAVGQKATDEELEKMKALLAQCLSEGAMGFSSTIAITHNDADGQPVPSRHASREELVGLAGVCKDHEGTSLEFLPAVGEFSEDVIDLMVDLTTAAQRPLNWNALSAGNPAVMENQLSASDRALERGGDIRALTIPQPISIRINLYTGFVFDALEGWADIFELPIDERIERFKDPAERKRLDESANSGGAFRGLARWSKMKVHATFLEKNKSFEGKTLAEIGEELGKTPFDAMLDLAVEEGLRTFFMPISGDTDPALWAVRAELWRDERTVIGASDAGAHLDMIDTFAFSSQVLGRGVREFNVVGLEEAVHQLTQVPAELFGLKERGVLEAGWFADLVIFDPEEVGAGEVYMRQDLPADEPRIYADAFGVRDVFVNGEQIIAGGAHTGRLPGLALRSGRDTDTPTMRTAS
ncbi:MAG: amidohydrolase family protein [Pseudomonadales bacterium]|nr:amidohydrolase family protein [Pseudomonadales bacterium]